MSGKVGSITTGIITDGLIFNVDPANRVSYPRTGTTVTDTIGNVTGTLNGTGGSNNTPQWENLNDGAFNFDGTDDRINLGTVSLNSYFSLSYWANHTTPNGYKQMFMGDNGIMQYTPQTSSTGKIRIWDGSSYIDVTSVVNDGNWFNIVHTYNGSTLKTYTNGSLTDSRSYSETVSNFKIIGGGIWYYEGKIANTHIYNRPISPIEVLHNYNALKDRFN